MTRRPGRRRRGRRRGVLVRSSHFMLREVGSAIAKVLSFAAVAAICLLALLDGRQLVLRELDPRLKQWAAERLGAEDVTVGSLGFSLGAGSVPAGLVLEDVRVEGRDGMPDLHVPRIATGFSVLDGVMGRVRPRTLEVDGLTLALTREADGTLRLGAGGDAADGLVLMRPGGRAAAPPDFAALLNAAKVFERVPMFSELERVDITAADLSFTDAATGRVWTADDASGYLRREDGGLSGAVRAGFREGDGAPIDVRAGITRSDRAGMTRYSVAFDDARPADIAQQVSVLGWLGLLDAPVDGMLAAEFRDDGQLAGLAGHLGLGAGSLKPGQGRTVGFDSGSAYFAYDPRKDEFEVSELAFESGFGALRSNGTVTIDRDEAGAISALVGQMDLSSIALARGAVPGETVHFPRGEAVARLTLDPFRVEFGNVSLRDGDARVTLRGHAAPRPSYWEVALDAGASDLDADRALALWPEMLAPGVRDWVAGHVQGGRVTRLDAAMRRTAEGPRAGLSFAFEDGTARIFPDMPALKGAAGSGQIIDGRFDLSIDAGHTGEGRGSGVDMAGSRMTVRDVREKPAMAEFDLAATGRIEDMLALVDNEPLGLLSRAGRTPDLATGQARARARVVLPLEKDIPAEAIDTTVTARLSDVASDTLVEGRPIAADALTLEVADNVLALRGPITLGGVPMRIAYRHGLDPDAPPATLAGRMQVTPETVSGLGIPLPDGSFDGEGEGRFALTLEKDAPPAFTADVDLAGASVAIQALDWRKAAASDGTLHIEGALSDPPRIDALRLSGPGLDMAGQLDLTGGGLAGAQLSRLRLGDWLDAPVTWRPRADGGADVAIRGGRVDLRGGLPEADVGGAGTRLTFDGGEVVVGDSIRLTGVKGEMSGQQEPRGRFTARLNGRQPIGGFLRGDNEVFIQSENGGAVLRDAGVFPNAFGGTLRVSLKAAPGGGAVRGAFSMQDTRVVSAATLADILDGADAGRLARSVRDEGVRFEDAQGRFVIDGGRLRLSDARAVGPTLGVTLEGSYDMAREAIDMSGVVSPLYALNGLVERLPIIGPLLGGRPGEGLLGATFRITGAGGAPKISVNPLSMLAPGAARGMFESRSRNRPGG